MTCLLRKRHEQEWLHRLVHLLERAAGYSESLTLPASVDDARARIEALARQLATRSGDEPCSVTEPVLHAPPAPDPYAAARLSPETVERMTRQLSTGSISVVLTRDQDATGIYYGCHTLAYCDRLGGVIRRSALTHAATLDTAVSKAIDVLEQAPGRAEVTP